MKKLAASVAAFAVLGSMAVAGTANAADDPIPFADINLTPKGPLYNRKEATTAADLSITAGVKPAPGATTLKPTITNDIGLPDYMTFNPDPKMPVCNKFKPEDDTNANMPYAQAIVDPDCAKAIVGNGRADLYIAGQVAALVTDAQLVNFNGGRDKNGNPVQYIHGYSQSTQAGVNIRMTETNGRLVMDIPRLSFGSSVPSFTTNIPGPIGLDKDYVQAACPTGDWTSTSKFTVADWDVATGAAINKETFQSEPYHQACVGTTAPKPKFSKVKVKGPSKVKANRKATFKVTVKNGGKTTAKGIKLKAQGAGKGSAKGSNIPGGKSKTFKIKAKVKGKKGKRVTVKVKVSAQNAKSKVGKTKVRLK
jgi:hypothetical protein